MNLTLTNRSRRAVSLVETMVVVSIIGILAAIGVPRFEQSLEQSRANIAAANLRAIWTAERAYWLQNNNIYASDLATLRSANLLDPGIVDDYGGSTTSDGSSYVYKISQSNSTTFQATARRVNAGSSGTLTIDQDGNGSGTVQINFSGGVTITPSFF